MSKRIAMSIPVGEVERIHEPSLAALAREVAKHIQSEQDMAALSRPLLKLTVESAWQAALAAHWGYERYASAGRGSGNSRHGVSHHTLKGEIGEGRSQPPRERNGTFEPPLMSKGQTRLTRFEGQILARYAQGMTTRDRAETFQEL